MVRTTTRKPSKSRLALEASARKNLKYGVRSSDLPAGCYYGIYSDHTDATRDANERQSNGQQVYVEMIS